MLTLYLLNEWFCGSSHLTIKYNITVLVLIKRVELNLYQPTPLMVVKIANMLWYKMMYNGICILQMI